MTETTLQKQILNVEWMGPSLNKIYAGTHWADRKPWADAGHAAVWACVINSKIKPVDKPAHLTFTPHIKGRRYDATNYALTVKIIEDGLVKEGILKSDTPKHVTGITINAPVKIKTRSYMVVEIRW